MMAGIRAKEGKCACGEKKEEESRAGLRETPQCKVSTNHVRDKAYLLSPRVSVDNFTSASPTPGIVLSSLPRKRM